MVVKVSVKRKRVKLRVSSADALRAAAHEIGQQISEQIARETTARTGQLAGSVASVERTTKAGTLKITTGPTGRRTGGGGLRRNAAVAVVLQRSHGLAIGLDDSAQERITDAAAKRFRVELEEK